jgi:Carboxypeptidase regulatory-like domain/Calcineurin-like phosphoesterase
MLSYLLKQWVFLSFVALPTIFLIPGNAQNGDFTVVVLPDTQYYSESYPAILNSQMQWIVNNAAGLNVQLVLGLGDIVNNGGSSTEWATADVAYKKLDAAHIRYFAPLGNHDYDANNPAKRTAATVNFNHYFGPSRYQNTSYWSTPYWQGSYPSGSNENFYGLVTINGQQFLILALEFYPRDASLSWAGQLIQNNPGAETIIITHAYEYFDNTRVSACNSFDAQYYGLGTDNDGDAMWTKLVRQYKNISLVLSGHEVRGAGQDATGHRSDVGSNGNLVNQILSNYQNVANGGNGYLRIMKFHPSSDTIDVLTYSPYLNSYLTDSGNQFTIPWHNWTGTGAGSIAGVVKDISSCAALPNAAVKSTTGSTVTNSSGAYTLGNIVPNTYSVVASSGSYVPVGRNIEVGSGMTASGKLFLGTGWGQFQGSTTDSTGAAISGATIHMVGSASTSAFDETITTDTTGKYASGSIPGGTYQVTASASGYGSSTVTASLGSSATVTQNFVLTPSANPNTSGGSTGGTSGGSSGGGTSGGTPGTISGQIVKDDTTFGLSGATVYYSGGSTATNSAGFYTLSNVPAGTSITVTASESGYGSATKTVTVTAGATSTLSFSLLPNCTISTMNLTVTICEPTANTTVLNPVHIIAKATDTTTVNHLEVWVDGAKKYQVSGGSMNSYVSMTTGVTHRITVQAVDNANQIFKQTVYATVQ